MKKVSGYGAGRFAGEILPLLKTEFDFSYIMDISAAKQGTTVDGVPVVAPSEKRIGEYPVIVLIWDILSAIETLNEFAKNTEPEIKLVFRNASPGKYILIDYRCTGLNVAENLNKSFQLSTPCFIPRADDYFSEFEIVKHSNHFVSKQPRIFNLCFYGNYEESGGPMATVRMIEWVNQKLAMLPNLITITPNRIFMPLGADIENGFIRDGALALPDVRLPFVENTCGWPSAYIRSVMWNNGIIISLMFLLQAANARFFFNKDDIFLFHDIFMTEAFNNMFPRFERVYCMSHYQGTVANECADDKYSAAYYNAIQLRHLQNIRHWIFTSNGAKEEFLRTCTGEMQIAAKSTHFHILYPCFKFIDDITPDPDFVDFLDKQCSNRGSVFVTATYLARNKGVERIPRVLSLLKNANVPFLWILVGGGEYEQQVRDAIRLYLEPEDYVWFEKRFDNQHNVFELFQRADFYIMMHRVSVFDLATMQAMYYGCIPILSDTGGNKEFCAFDNGVLFDPDNISDDELLVTLLPYLNGSDSLQASKQLTNKKIVRERFGYENFLRQYADLLSDYSESKQETLKLEQLNNK
jgi:glycosyltransferase involved in cell wall biosynthesis